MKILGIDPGKTGCLALLDSETFEAKVYDFPALEKDIDTVYLVNTLIPQLGKVDIVAIENVHAMPLQSTVAGFKFGVNVGIAKMIPAILNCRVHYVTPQKWKKFFLIGGGERKQLKEKAVFKARELFPQLINVLLKSKDGRSEALLIAEYARLNLL